MKKIYILLFIFNSYNLTHAQIAISEVNYDTPVLERFGFGWCFAGEFIELFNYSTEDIDISNWRLSDNMYSYFFPEGTTIQSGDYLIVARVQQQNDYFFTFFPNNQSGNEGKVLYNHRLILNNYRDHVSLSTKIFNEKPLKSFYLISKARWDSSVERNPHDKTTFIQGNINPDYNYYKESYQKKDNLSLRTLIHLASSTSYDTATPFELTFTPELLELQDIANLNDILYLNYDNFTWDEDVLEILSNSCDNLISTINEPAVSDTYIEEHFFNYDESGNQEFNSPEEGGSDDSEADFLEEIANKIYVSPNPTYNTVTLSWDADISDLIVDISIAQMNGATNIPLNFSSGSTSYDIDLSSYPTGMYVVNFHLNTNQFVSKIILKI